MSIPDRNFTVRLPDEVRDALEECAAAEDVKPGALARRIIRLHLQPVLKRRQSRAPQAAPMRSAG